MSLRIPTNSQSIPREIGSSFIYTMYRCDLCKNKCWIERDETELIKCPYTFCRGLAQRKRDEKKYEKPLKKEEKIPEIDYEL